MANELDELYGMVTNEADKTALQQILARNPVAQERAEAQAALFAALATGDNESNCKRADIASPVQVAHHPLQPPPRRRPPPPPPRPSTSSPGWSQARWHRAIQPRQFATKEAAIRAQALADAKAEMQIEGGKLLVAAMSNSDAVYTVQPLGTRRNSEPNSTPASSASFSTPTPVSSQPWLPRTIHSWHSRIASSAASHRALTNTKRPPPRLRCPARPPICASPLTTGRRCRRCSTTTTSSPIPRARTALPAAPRSTLQSRRGGRQLPAATPAPISTQFGFKPHLQLRRSREAIQ